jgi:phasin family protein
MSKPNLNPFADQEFSKYFDVSKVVPMPNVFNKMPNMGFEALLEAQRKNMQAFAAASQAAAEGMQGLMRRQSEIMRQTLQENTTLMNEIMSSHTPEEKVAKQVEMAKAVFDRCVGNGKELTDMAAKSQYEAMEVLSLRMGECLQELRTMMRAKDKAAKS